MSGGQLRSVSDRRRRRDAVYPERRKQVWERGQGLCEHCLARPMGEVHHRAGRGGPDPHHLGNLVGLCSPCHKRAHAEPQWALSVGLMVSRLAK
jgi:5-methylcytosine-specific restriction endonuclease McrA